MKIFLVIFLIMALNNACVTTGIKPRVEKYTKEAISECSAYCGSTKLSYRNETTYFCECSSETIVVSKTGTIYK